ncbi:hypothetical protein ACLOAU_07425 [Niabella sp. CJ426]|jgi:hypothetical protein|uniref:hypothetical protein n=1 Tax=Niabella sp. CJ426 TaxID=3393740 RepID=UPI003D08B3CB
MKKLSSRAILLMYLCVSINGWSQTGTRSYGKAIGGRLGFVGKHQAASDIDFAAVSYKRFFSAKSAIEANLGWGARSDYPQSTHHISFSANYQLHFPIGETGLRPFIGGGAAAIYATRRQIRYGTAVGRLFPAFYPILGIDYKSGRNFNMSVDVRPMTRLLGKRTQQFNSNTDFAPYAGISFRRSF